MILSGHLNRYYRLAVGGHVMDRNSVNGDCLKKECKPCVTLFTFIAHCVDFYTVSILADCRRWVHHVGIWSLVGYLANITYKYHILVVPFSEFPNFDYNERGAKVSVASLTNPSPVVASGLRPCLENINRYGCARSIIPLYYSIEIAHRTFTHQFLIYSSNVDTCRILLVRASQFYLKYVCIFQADCLWIYSLDK